MPEKAMSNEQITYPLRISEIPKSKAMPFDIVFTDRDLETIAGILSAQSVKKMRINGKIAPYGKKDWQLTAIVGATVVQACVVTLDPVQTRIDTPISLTYSADYEFNNDDTVVEMTIDETIEPLSDEIDLASIAIEAVAMALPDYPRSQNAQLESAVFTEPGNTPMTDEDTKPFASLASLKDKLSKDGK
jgi:uncharacterized metal-binding protein YceD (DUF177 family)